jgi:hypothetical protein
VAAAEGSSERREEGGGGGSGGGGRRRGRWERKRRVIWTSDLREQGRGLGLGRRLWLRGGTVPLLDVAQIDAQRRGGAREAADQGGSKAGRRQGGGGGGRRGRLRLVEKWRRRVIRVSGVNIYKHHDECRPSDREIDGSRRPRCWWADVKVGRFKVGLCGLTFSFLFFFYCTIVK